MLVCLKRRQSTENEQMQVPLPVMAVKIPPRNPLKTRMAAFHGLKSWIESNVLRLYCLAIKKMIFRMWYFNNSSYNCLEIIRYFNQDIEYFDLEKWWYNRITIPVEKKEGNAKAPPDADKNEFFDWRRKQMIHNFESLKIWKFN